MCSRNGLSTLLTDGGDYDNPIALGRLIPKRKVWCVLEESRCQLHYYKTEEDFHKHRAPLGYLDITGSAISLDLEHQNQFAVICEGKEHIFTAENHESMMIWLLGLQAKRDIHSRKNISSPQDKDESFKSFEADLVSHRPSLFMTCDLHGTELLVTQQNHQSSLSTARRKYFWEKNDYHKWGESVDSGIGTYKKRFAEFAEHNTSRSRSLPPVFEALESSRSFPLSVRQQKSGLNKRISSSQAMLYHDSDSDDVFGGESVHRSKKAAISMSHWKKLQSAVMGHVLQSNTKLSSESTGIESGERNSLSSRSMSSDSAIEKGEGTPRELTARLTELEKDLISTKCELAKVLNQQTGYQELLQHKDETIKQLEVGTSGENPEPIRKETKKVSLKRQKSEKEFNEKIRVLQNQNRFLNEEVKKLAKIRLNEHGHFQEQNSMLQSLEAEIEKWKMDYVCLIQSSIRYPGEEGVEDLELCLYGGDKHKKRVQNLLEEARKINPRLPTFESLSNNEVHVDTYGFKHVYSNTGLLLHYLCTELTNHYLVQAGVYEDHQKKWTMFMRQHGKDPMLCPLELKVLCRGGVPDRFRKQIWHHLVHYKVRHIMKEKGDYYFRNLCNLLPESPIMDLQDVLLSFCVHNPTIGYCQGMNFIVGMSLLFMEPEDAFWTLVAIAECYFSPHYFDHNLIGAQADQQVLKDMVKEKLPRLSEHLEGIDIELSTITLNWFLAVFFDAVPFQTLLRVWDCFLLEGPKVLFRFSLAILKLHENDILQKTDTMGIMKHLKTCAKLTFDVEGLVKLAFEGMKPFQKRKDIVTKETCYLNALKEKHKKKELQRLAFAEREQLYMSMEAESAGMFLGIECAVAIEDGKIWICYGDQHIGHLCFVSCEHGTMISMEYKLDSRMMCMCTMGKNKLVLGTLSWMLVCLEVNRQEQLWQIQLHDAILSVCCYDDEDAMAVRIFSGLADGTVAVAEKMNNRGEPNLDVIYIPIGQAPVTCTMLLGDQLWCASGNSVAVIHAKTLDTMDIFSVSINPYDHILSLIPSEYGIWISLRGSSILELWDPKSLNCRMLYDTRTDRYPQLRKEDDAYFNRARITSMMAYDNTVWVGTGEGNLIIYEIVESAQLKTPTDLSPSLTMETASTKSCIARPERKIAPASCLKIHLMEDRDQLEREIYTPDSMEVIPDLCTDRPRLDSYFLDEDVSIENNSCEVMASSNELRPAIRRRSSSENDMCRDTRYMQDCSVTSSNEEQNKNRLGLENTLVKKVPSANDIGTLGKRRYQTQNEYPGNIEELENEMEEKAWKESFSLMYETTFKDETLSMRRLSHDNSHSRKSSVGGHSARSSRRSSLEALKIKRKSSLRNMDIQKLRMDKSDDSGCESRSRSLLTRTSDSVSHKSSLYRKTCDYGSYSGQDTEEDVFELKEEITRNSFKNMSLDPKVMELLQTRLNMKKVEESSDTSSDSDTSCASSGRKLRRNDTQTRRMEEGSYTCSIIPEKGFMFDDSYLSSSPTDSCKKVDTLSNHVQGRKKASVLGISVEEGIESEHVGKNGINEDTSSKSDGAEHPSSAKNGSSPEQSIEGTTKKRRPSVIEDISQLCFECKKLENGHCADCSILLTGQESLRQIERRLSDVDKCDIDLIRMFNKQNGVVKSDGVLDSDTVDQDTGKKNTTHNGDKNDGYENVQTYKNPYSSQSDIIHENGKPGNMLPVSKERKDMTRQDRVRVWLSAISQEDSLQINSDVEDAPDNHQLTDQSPSNGTDRHNSHMCRREKTVMSPKRPETLQLSMATKYGYRRKDRLGSAGSDDSSGSVTKKPPRKPEMPSHKDVSGAQYRLDFSGTHVGTDMDSEETKSGNIDQPSPVLSVDFMMKQSGLDSRRNSLDLGVIQENCKRLEKHVDNGKDRLNGDMGNLGKPSERQRIFEFLKTPSLATRHMSLGLKIIDNDLEWTDLFSGQYTTPSPGSSTDQRLADFLRTPTISSRPSSLWSSYENISTPSQFEPIDNKLLHPNTLKRRLSHSASTASIGSGNDLIYNVDLNLEAKVKISDKPVKCLLASRCKDEPIIMSFSGSYGDDEAVLKWRKHENEQLWTNEPILELCPKTRAAILPSYMRRRLSSNSSFTSHASVDSGVNLRK